MNTLLVAIHGILTGQTNPSWPDELDAWMSREHPAVRVLKKEYVAGPFPRWNCRIKNPRLAEGLAAEMRLLLEANFVQGAAGEPEAPGPQVWIVAHSNGALIALATAKRLIQEGHTVAGLILIGAACDADIERNGIAEWIQTGALRFAIAYASPDDHVVPGIDSGKKRHPLSRLYQFLVWPYGTLGRTGRMFRGRQLIEPLDTAGGAHRIFTRWFAGGHSGYFALEQLEYTFRQIARDITS